MSKAQKILEQMTLREKVGQLNQHLYGFDAYVKSAVGEVSPAADFIMSECGKKDGFEWESYVITPSKTFTDEVEHFGGIGFLYGLYRSDPWSGKNFRTGLTKELAPKTYNMLQRYVLEHSRLGIPMAQTSECPHGNQILGGYLYPVNLAVGATFDPELFEKATQKAGIQLKALGVQMALMSLLDVCRDPRWGRSEECFSEDPYLASVFAGAGARGMQKSGVGSVAKHLAGQGQTTGGVNASSALIGWNELRDIHLKTMEACAKEKAAGVMAAYNDVDGIPCHANKALLQKYLRDELGYKGLIFADGVAIDRLDVVTGDNHKSGLLAIESGVEVSLWDNAFHDLDKAFEDLRKEDKDRADMVLKSLDEAVAHVLEFKEQMGLFDKPFVDEKDKYIALGKIEGENDPSYKLSSQSLVLLKNDKDILPLEDMTVEKDSKKLLLVGDASRDIYRQLGDYTPYVDDSENYTVYDGFMSELGKGAFSYKGNSGFAEQDKDSRTYDTIVCVIGGSSSRFDGAEFDSNGAAIVDGESGNPVAMDCGEGVDSANLQLPGKDLELLRKLRKEYPRAQIVTVVIAGRAYVIQEVIRLSDAVLYCFYPGPMGGLAIARAILGKEVPSGLLPVSIPRNASHLPCYYNYRASYEGMKYVDMKQGAEFSFGYGLSYNRFEYGEIQKTTNDDGTTIITFSAFCTQGERVAGNTIMLFGHRKSGIPVPRVKELLDFKKVYLGEGESKRVVLEVPEGFDGELFIADGRGLIQEISLL